MSGIRPTSGITPGLTGTSPTPATGQGNVAPVSAATPAHSGGDLTASAKHPAGREALPQQTEIQAVVTAKSGPDNVILHSEYGNFRMATATPLALGSRVTFEITNAEDIVLARLLSINGKALTPPPDIRLLPVIEKIIAGAEGYIKAGQLHPAELKAGLEALSNSLAVSPLPAKGTAAATAATAPALPPGAETRLSALIRQARESIAALPASPAASAAAPKSPAAVPLATSPAQPEVQAAAVPIRQQGVAAYQKQIPPVLPGLAEPGAAVPPGKAAVPRLPYIIADAKVVEPRPGTPLPGLKDPAGFTAGAAIKLIIRPVANSAEPPPATSGFLQGTVFAQGDAAPENGQYQVHIRTPAGTLSFPSSKPLPPGTTVQVAAADTITAFPLPPMESRPAAGPLPKLALMTDWQNLREAMNVVAQQDPLLAQNLVNNLIPQATSRLSSHLLFFMAALQLGSVEKWLGPDFSHALRESGRSSLLKALDDDFNTFSRLQGASGGQDWKNLNFPFFDGSNLRQIRMFHRQRDNPDAPEGEQKTTRFVIELNLSKSGPLQLDGLFKKRLFDLTIRSQSEVPEDMKAHILSLFNEHMEISGLRGQLVFKTIAPFPVNPLQEWESGMPAIAAGA